MNKQFYHQFFPVSHLDSFQKQLSKYVSCQRWQGFQCCNKSFVRRNNDRRRQRKLFLVSHILIQPSGTQRNQQVEFFSKKESLFVYAGRINIIHQWRLLQFFHHQLLGWWWLEVKGKQTIIFGSVTSYFYRGLAEVEKIILLNLA